MAGLADISALEQQALNQANQARRLNLVGGIMQGVGTLADTVNSIYQASKGRTPIPIGAPITAGGMITSNIGTLRKDDASRNMARATLRKIPSLNPTIQSIADAQILSGNPKEGLSDAAKYVTEVNKPESMNAEEKLYEQLGPEGFMRYKQGLAASGRSVINVNDRAAAGVAGEVLKDAYAILSNPYDKNGIPYPPEVVNSAKNTVKAFGPQIGVPDLSGAINPAPNQTPATPAQDPNSPEAVTARLRAKGIIQ